MRKVFYAIVIVALVVVGWKVYEGRRVEGINNQAVRLIEEERYEDAVVLLTGALMAKPDNTAIRRNLATAYGAMGRHDKAKEVYSAYQAPDGATDTGPTDAQVLARMQARVERMKAEGWKPEEGVSREHILKVAETSFSIGNLKDAEILYERALFLDPTDVVVARKLEALEKMKE
jgi:tetratricopeptide (TPR) repeat protein